MKLLFFSHAAGPYGAERVLVAMARGLAARGHDVTLAFPQPGPAAEIAEDLTGVRVHMDRQRPLPRSLSEVLPYLVRAGRHISAARRLVRETAPDVVWINATYNPWAAIGARLAGAPAIWHIHERGVPGARTLVALLIGAVAIRVVAISRYVADDLGRFPWLRRRIRIARNPLLEPLTPSPPAPARPFTVGYVGQLEPRKRAPDLARAVASLPGVRAIVVGDGKARRALERAVEAAGIQDRVALRGYQPDGPAEMAAFDCLAIPSLREPFGLVALEAMARGIPVIAARSGALPDVLGDAALYHRPRDPGNLAQQIARLRDDDDLRRALRERGLRRVAAFGRDGWLDEIERILDEVVARRSPDR